MLLDEVDRELQRRGHCFVRYADDCNVYVRRLGESVARLCQVASVLHVARFFGLDWRAGQPVRSSLHLES